MSDDMETLAGMIEPDAFNPKSKVYWNTHPDAVDHIRGNARVRASNILQSDWLTAHDRDVVTAERERVLSEVREGIEAVDALAPLPDGRQVLTRDAALGVLKAVPVEPQQKEGK